MRPKGAAAVEDALAADAVHRRHVAHLHQQRHVHGAVRGVRAEPQAQQLAGARLHDECVARAEEADGPLPAALHLLLALAAAVPVHGAEGARREAHGLAVRRPLVVVAVHGERHGRRHGRVGPRERRVRAVVLEVRVGGGEVERGREQVVHAPHAAPAVVAVRVLAVAVHTREVERAVGGLPQPVLLRQRVQVRREEEVVRVARIHLAHHEHVRHHAQRVVRHALRHPHRRRVRRVREHVEDEALGAVHHHLRLARALKRVRALEAILDREVAHHLHGRARRRRALEGDARHLVDGQQPHAAAVRECECLLAHYR
mmetsp:Transcript_14433/g.50194  ORF Transcript_14433/g.50194 Transcript_14433/m.50194 type:complete len:315 (-) Transcript_14433:513-1457(-)